jgi:hypothetical protein
MNKAIEFTVHAQLIIFNCFCSENQGSALEHKICSRTYFRLEPFYRTKHEQEHIFGPNFRIEQELKNRF